MLVLLMDSTTVDSNVTLRLFIMLSMKKRLIGKKPYNNIITIYNSVFTILFVHVFERSL